MRVVNLSAGVIDYRLNILGVRVSEHSCQLIAKGVNGWDTLGPRWDLPVHVPRTSDELKQVASDTLRMTAYQYNVERPGSDIVEVLSRARDFAVALHDTTDPSTGRVARVG
jgi:hypothetical protein